MTQGFSGRVRAALPPILVLCVLLVPILAAHPALAQAHNPFSVGISEGGGPAGGLVGWIIQQQVMFQRQLAATIRAVRTDGSALWLLIGLSFAYGVFHAAGPGHGKAVMASYLFANERALRRGLVLSLLAALLQGLVAVIMVGILALVLHATAQRMKDAASLVESLSYAGVALLGGWLVWRKGRRFMHALVDEVPAPAFASSGTAKLPLALALPSDTGAFRLQTAGCLDEEPGALVCLPVAAGSAHQHGPDCGHLHAPDPARLGEDFAWREAILTVVAAGSRPCSGAILVLVYGMAQGMFAVGVASVLAMSLGTAITTGALASTAVLAKGLALRVSAPGSRRGTLLIRGLETAAAAVVLAAGLSLFLGYAALGGS